jgi:hypothetical protein
MTIPVSAITTPSIPEWAVPKASGGEWSVGGIGGEGPGGAKPAATDPSGGVGSMLSQARIHI